MPNMQAIIERLNALFSREHINELDPAVVAPGETLAAAAQGLSAAASSAEIRYISSWPAAQQEAIRAALYSALTRKPRLPVTMSWAPGYDFEVSIWEAAGTAQSIGGMTILFRSRYPGDRIAGVRTRSHSR